MRARIIFGLLIVSLAAAVNLSAQTLTTLATFDGTNGSAPAASLIQASDGNFYGTTQYGGTVNGCEGGFNPCGTVFKITSSGTLTTLHTFDYGDGAFPVSPVVQGSDGNFYGTNVGEGDSDGPGAIFKMTSDGTVTVLQSVSSVAGLVQGLDGDFYGTTPSNPYTAGTVFKITPSGTLTTLHTFNGTDGKNPQAGLVRGSDGNFYGTTYSGGTSNNCGYGCGTVFKMTPGGSLTTLHSFSGTDGYNVQAGLVEGRDGNFYGTTLNGGPQNVGEVYKITPSGTLTVLYSFCSKAGCTDGSYPKAGLAQATDGNFYGTTFQSGSHDQGTVFSITPSGSLTTLYNFCSQASCADGANPVGGVIQGSDGNFYGTTQAGGSNSSGTVFKLSLPPTYTLSVYKSGSGTVTSGDNNINCGSVCSYNYVGGTQVTLTPTPSSGWAFAYWSGCDNVNNNVCTVTMNSAHNVTAVFTPTYQLTVLRTGNGTVTSNDGYINCGSTCSHLYWNGTVVVLTASPDPNWVFASWSGCDKVNGNVCTVTMNSVRTVTASFTPTYVLTVAKTGNGTVKSSDNHINCGSTCSYTYLSGTLVTLTASPDSGWGFAGWSGCDQSNSNVCLVVMSANRTATATFQVLYPLTVSKTGNGNVSSIDGHISCGSTCSYSYMNGTLVTLSAVPAAGSTFSSWTGCNNANGSFCYVTVSSARNVTATFASVNNIILTALTFKPSYVKGGELSAGTLTMNVSAPSGGLAIALSSDHPGVAHPPAFVFVPGGQKSVQFAVETLPVKSNTVVTITATESLSHVSGTLTVGTTPLPPALK